MKNVLGPIGVTVMAAGDHDLDLRLHQRPGPLGRSGDVRDGPRRPVLSRRSPRPTGTTSRPLASGWPKGPGRSSWRLPMTVKVDPLTQVVTYGNTYDQLLDFLTPVDLTFYMLMVGSVVVFRIQGPQGRSALPRVWLSGPAPLLSDGGRAPGGRYRLPGAEDGRNRLRDRAVRPARLLAPLIDRSRPQAGGRAAERERLIVTEKCNTLAECGRKRNRRVGRALGEPHQSWPGWWGSPEARPTLHF